MASKTEKKEIPLDQQDLTPLQYSILEKLNELGPMTRDQLCEEFGFGKHEAVYLDNYLLREKGLRYEVVGEQYNKRTTIYDNLKKMEKRKLVERFSRITGKRGRPLVYWKIKK